MSNLRSVLVGFGVTLALVSMVLVAYSTAGFSFNQGANRSAYFSYVNLPVFENQIPVGVDETVTVGIDGFNLEYFYGLRLIVAKCEGSRCNEKGGDDIADPVESFRWQNCDYDDDAGPFRAHGVCEDCRVAGLVTGSFIIITLFLAVPSVFLMALRFKESWDNIGLRFGGVALHAMIFILELILLSVYAVVCYHQLGDFYSDDDTVDKGDVEYLLGPGYIANIAVLLLQPFLIALHAGTPHAGGGDSPDDRGGKGMSAQSEL